MRHRPPTHLAVFWDTDVLTVMVTDWLSVTTNLSIKQRHNLVRVLRRRPRRRQPRHPRPTLVPKRFPSIARADIRRTTALGIILLELRTAAILRIIEADSAAFPTRANGRWDPMSISGGAHSVNKTKVTGCHTLYVTAISQRQSLSTR